MNTVQKSITVAALAHSAVHDLRDEESIEVEKLHVINECDIVIASYSDVEICEFDTRECTVDFIIKDNLFNDKDKELIVSFINCMLVEAFKPNIIALATNKDVDSVINLQTTGE